VHKPEKQGELAPAEYLLNERTLNNVRTASYSLNLCFYRSRHLLTMATMTRKPGSAQWTHALFLFVVSFHFWSRFNHTIITATKQR